jgi:osmoprotectant transport system substrate-binding protein
MERPDGYRGWVEKYQLQFTAPPRTLDLGLLYRALAEKQVDIVAGNSTDGAIHKLDFVVLEDDLHYFPPYEAVPVVRKEVLARHSQVRQALGELDGHLSEDDMRRLNYAVDGEQKDVRDVVGLFLREKSL